MRAKAGLLIILGLLLIVASVSAAGLTATMSSSKEWVIANGVDQAVISVYVTNSTTLLAVPGAVVTFTVEGYPYGTMTPVAVTTDTSGNAISVFKVNKKSGTATINASVSFSDATSTIQTYYQKIDHDTPYIPHFEYPYEGTVATEVPFNVSITDAWGNRIDDRKELALSLPLHTISLHVHGPAPDDCVFISSATHDLSKTLDANGNTSVMVKLTSSYGPNSILMDKFGSIQDKLEWIVAVTSGTPFSITQTYDPTGSPPQLPADGVQKFTIKYMVYDRFGNPTNTQPVKIITSVAGEDVTYISNSIGQVWFTYGPKSFTGNYTITATTVNNNSVTISNEVRFYNTSAENFETTSNPSQMGSLDANPTSQSDITAKVIDVMGNPVGGEVVSFSIGAITYPGGPYNSTSLPTLANTSATTDSYGMATVKFIPGAFSKDIHVADYRSSATGTCQVNVVWDGITKPVTVTWKNYPYLSIITSVSPQTVKLNETVDVNIRLYGDGYALGHNPIDAMLVLDRSGSMGWTMPGTTHTKMYYAKQAATSFVNQMTPSSDQVGLVSYSTDSIVDNSLSNNFAGVTGKIATLSTGGGTNTRTGFKQAIADVVAYRNGDPKSVQAVILMTDGAFNQDGDPLARGTGRLSEWYGTDGTQEYYIFPNPPFTESQDMSVYAKKYNIRLYTITFGLDVDQTNSSLTYDAMTLLSTNTGGTHYHANTGAELGNVYSDIAGKLKTEAGVDTQVLLDYGTIIVNNVTDTSGQVFSYIPDPPTLPSHAPGSTWIHKFNKTHESINTIMDQSSNWTTNKQLDFNVGTVNLNETWEATFRLKVLKEGNINVFGPNSFIKFNDSMSTGITTATIPGAYFTGSQTLNMTGMSSKTITLMNLRCTETGEIKALLPVAWTTSYTGISPLGVREQVYYSVNNAPFVKFAEITGIPSGMSSQQAQLDVTKLPPGGYMVKVVATAEDTPDAVAYLPAPITVNGRDRPFIKIE